MELLAPKAIFMGLLDLQQSGRSNDALAKHTQKARNTEPFVCCRPNTQPPTKTPPLS